MAPHTTQFRARYCVGLMVAYDLDDTYYTRYETADAMDVDWLFIARIDVLYYQRKKRKRSGLSDHLRKETGIGTLSKTNSFYWITNVQGQAVEAASIALAAGDCQGGWPIRKLDTTTGEGGEVSEAGIPDWASKILQEEDIPLVAEVGSESDPIEDISLISGDDRFIELFDLLLVKRKGLKLAKCNYAVYLTVERRKYLNANVPV